MNDDGKNTIIKNPDAYNPNYIYNDNKWYCYKNGIWIQLTDKLRQKVEDIIITLNLYDYLIQPIKKFYWTAESQFIYNVVKELKTKYRNDSIKFNHQQDILVFKIGKLNFATGKFEPLTQKGY